MLRMRCMAHVLGMEEIRYAYKIMIGRPEGKRPFGRPRCSSEDNTKMDL
jgi:hypothetical protein